MPSSKADSPQGPVFETLTGEPPPVPPGTTVLVQPPKKEDDAKQ